VRAFRIPITAIITALVLSGCMRTTGPVAVTPQGDLDSMAYGQPNSPPPQAVAADSGGGAIGALRAAFAASPHAVPAPVVVAAPVAYVEPMPVRYDAAYHLDAGDRLRVVVYGQEGLTNTYAIDAGGSITMPLIGSVPARGRTGGGDIGEAARRLHQGAVGRGGDRSVSAVLHPRRGRSTRAISVRTEHDGRERGGDRRRLFAACPPR
jgi:polysaccharide export outer membrane protein